MPISNSHAGRKEFNGHDAIHERIVGAKDGSGAALADFGFEAVAGGEKVSGGNH